MCQDTNQNQRDFFIREVHQNNWQLKVGSYKMIEDMGLFQQTLEVKVNRRCSSVFIVNFEHIYNLLVKVRWVQNMQRLPSIFLIN